MNAWPEERVEELKKYWAAGLSQGEIARMFGTTSSAIAGKLGRLGLHNKKEKIDIRPKTSNRRFYQPIVNQTSIALPKTTIQFDPNQNYQCTIIELNDKTCRWPLWDQNETREFIFCGAPALTAGPYCQPHMKKSGQR